MFWQNQSGVLQNKICPFLAQGICDYVGHSFLGNTVELIPFILYLSYVLLWDDGNLSYDLLWDDGNLSYDLLWDDGNLSYDLLWDVLC